MRDIYEKPASTTLPTSFGIFHIHVWAGAQGQEVVALTTPVLTASLPVLVRIHSECLTGDVFHSLRCDCNEQKEKALRMISESGNGIFMYLRQEGRGIGLYEKIKAYRVQEQGHDTVEANIMLGHPADNREYSWAGHILRYFKAVHVHLLTNNPSKIAALIELDFTVERVALITKPTAFNRQYLETKRVKFDHILDEQDPHFFGLSYVTDPKEVVEIGEFVRGKLRDPSVRIGIGIYADHTILESQQEREQLSQIFEATKAYSELTPILHFSFRNSISVVDDIKKLHELLPFIERVQLNDVPTDYMETMREACRQFLVHMPLDDAHFHLTENDEFVSLCKKYKTLICLDNSKGSGTQDSFQNLAKKIDGLVAQGLDRISIHGGFGPDRLDTYFQLRNKYGLRLSVDAETHLQTEHHLDLEKVKEYLEELLT